jgi:hypothetical protein
MSNYIRETRHPRTGQWEQATWIDDLFGRHCYGVVFPSDVARLEWTKGLTAFRLVAFDPETTPLETREPEVRP